MALSAGMETGAATAVVGLAAYQLWDAWNKNAPSLAELRAAGGHDLGTAQQLLDAEMTVGTLAGIIGLTFLALTGRWNVLLIMVLIFATLSLWHHAVLNSDPR